MSTLSKNLFIRKIKSFFLQFLYGISITVPTSSNYGYRGVFFIVFSSCWINFSILLSPFIKLGIINDKNVFLLSTFLSILVFVLLSIKYNKITNILDKTKAEKLYWLDVNSHKEEHYSELIRTHRNVSKYNRLKYMKNKSLVDEYKRYNMKWRFIAVIYILITIFNLYLLDKLNL